MTQLHFPNSIIIKPVGSFCNLNCDYCFYLSKNNLHEGDSSRHRMSANILETIIKEMFFHSNEPSFIWHGGEPTLMGFDFLTKIISFQKKYSNGKKYHDSIQTNGFFLSTTWMDVRPFQG